MATKKSTKNSIKKAVKNIIEPQSKDWYDDYKPYDASKEKRRFIDVLYALMMIFLGLGGLLIFYYISK